MGIGTIAFNTFREAVRSKAYYVLVLAGVVMLLLWVLVPFFSQGNDLPLLKEMVLGTIPLMGVLTGTLVAGTVVASELSDRTAMTLLSKPVGRPQFVLGKFLGVQLTVLSGTVLMGLVALGAVWLRALMELEPFGSGTYEEALARVARLRWYHVGTVVPGLALALMQVALMSAVAVALAMRLPLAPTAVGVMGLYLLGHLLPRLADTAAPGSTGAVFLRGLCWVFPSLQMYDVGNQIMVGQAVPWGGYVLPTLLYTVLYGLAALLVAMVLFRERELS